MSQPGVFLSAEWRNLLMLNYPVPPQLLHPFVPCGTELDLWEGEAYCSIVGFMFLNTKLLGWPIPFHRHFEELNLRFYVRRKAPEGWRRSVVFIKELVPKRAVAWVARYVYNENYAFKPMRHELALDPKSEGGLTPGSAISYSWYTDGRWENASAKLDGPLIANPDGSHSYYITEHYWGYVRQQDGGTMEYEVQHPPWRVWKVKNAQFDANAGALYGDCWKDVLRGPPHSAFVADGSGVFVRKGTRLVLTQAELEAHAKLGEVVTR